MSQIQISLKTLKEAVTEKPPTGTMTYGWAPNATGISEAILLVGLNDYFTHWDLASGRQFYIRTFRQGDVLLIQLTLQLGQKTYELWVDYCHPEEARWLEALAGQERLTAALCTSRKVAGALTLVNGYQTLLVNLIVQIKQGQPWTADDFAGARDAIGRKPPV